MQRKQAVGALFGALKASLAPSGSPSLGARLLRHLQPSRNGLLTPDLSGSAACCQLASALKTPHQAARWQIWHHQRRSFQSWSSPYRGYRSAPDGDTALKALIGINLAGWLLWQTNPSFMKQHAIISLESISNLRLHTLLTAAFSHFDGWHLFSNMLALYFFGGSIGRIFGGRMLVRVYVTGAIISSLAHVGVQWWQSKGQAWYRQLAPGALGASGAVNALVIFTVLLQPNATVLIYGILPLPAWAFGGLWLLYDLRGAYTQAPGVAYAGHLGGAAVGGLFYLAFRRGRLR